MSRSFIARHEDVSTVICAPVYSQVLGLSTEVVLGTDDGLHHESAIRCDFLMLMFKAKLTHFIATLSPAKTADLNRALALTRVSRRSTSVCTPRTSWAWRRRRDAPSSTVS